MYKNDRRGEGGGGGVSKNRIQDGPGPDLCHVIFFLEVPIILFLSSNILIKMFRGFRT